MNGSVVVQLKTLLRRQTHLLFKLLWFHCYVNGFGGWNHTEKLKSDGYEVENEKFKLVQSKVNSEICLKPNGNS